MKTRHVWVVEMMNQRTDKWEPTVGVDLLKDDALAMLRTWQKRNPDDQFRIIKYEATR